MMTKFYKLDKGDIYNQYLEYEKNVKYVHKFVIKFLPENGFEAHLYCCQRNGLYIVPTENDLKKFNSILCKPEKGDYKTGLRKIKKSSSIAKKWVKTLKDNNLKITEKPYAMRLFAFVGKISYEIFKYKNTYYYNVKTDYTGITPIGDVEEIKGSEYYKASEEWEEGLKNNEHK